MHDAISEFTDESEQIDAISKIRHQYRIEEGSKYYTLVQEYVSEDVDLPEAIDKLFGPIYEGIHRFNQSELQFFDLWHSILHSAKRIPFQNVKGHKRLVEFVGAYQKQPHPPGMYNGIGPGGIFGSLYGFSYTVMNYWNDVPGHGSGCTEPEVHAWANLNYFLACIAKEGICDWRHECLSAMRGALEDIMREKRVSKKFNAFQLYDTLVPAAAVWVFALQGKLYEKEVDMTSRFGTKIPNYAYGGELYTGKSGFNKERWRLWKRRFGEISQMMALSEETRKLAKEAFDVMDQSEPSVPGHRCGLRPRKTKSTVSDASLAMHTAQMRTSLREEL